MDHVQPLALPQRDQGVAGIRKSLHRGAGDLAHVEIAQEGVAQRQHGKIQAILTPPRRMVQVAKPRQRVRQSRYGWLGQGGSFRDLAIAEPDVLRRERGQDRKTARHRRDDVAVFALFSDFIPATRIHEYSPIIQRNYLP